MQTNDTTDLEGFRKAVQEYCQLGGFTQKALANKLSLHPVVLSNKLNGTRRYTLTFPEIKQILKTLIEWEVVYNYEQVSELLGFLNLTESFLEQEGQLPPFSSLKKEKKDSGAYGQAGKITTATPLQQNQPRKSHNNLPAQTTPLIGRVAEVATISELISQAHIRLVTLTGPGGVGKTRIALQVATELASNFEQGVCFVDLTTISKASQVAQAIARTFGLKDNSSETTILKMLSQYLQDKQLLLILDNFEHVKEATSLVKQLLANAPQLKILLTSRLLLQIYGEHEFVTAPMDLPSREDLAVGTAASNLAESLLAWDAIALFVARAQAVKPGFNLTAGNAALVAKICQQLDGLPLAIELAAVRLKTLPLEFIAEKLANSLDFLKNPGKEVASRQQTLKKTLQWSYNFLDNPAKQLFRQLAVFRGGFSLDALQTICLPLSKSKLSASSAQFCLEEDSLLLILEDLVNSSLVQTVQVYPNPPQTIPVSKQVRFKLLETIREFGLGLLKLAELSPLEHGFSSYYTSIAETGMPKKNGIEQMEWLDELEIDHANLLKSLEIVFPKSKNPKVTPGFQELEQGLCLMESLRPLWFVRGYWNEAIEWLNYVFNNSTLDLANLSSKGLSHLAGNYYSLGLFTGQYNDFNKSQEYYKLALDLYKQLNNPYWTASSLVNLGYILYAEGKFEEARTLFEEAKYISNQNESAQRVLTNINIYLALIYSFQGDIQQARNLYEQTLPIVRKANDTAGIITTLHNFSSLLSINGEPLVAREYLDEALALAQKLNSKRNIAIIKAALGVVSGQLGDYITARRSILESIPLCIEINYTREIPFCILGLAGLAAATQNFIQAARLLAAAQNFLLGTGSTQSYAYEHRYRPYLATIKANLDEPTFEQEWKVGKNLTLEQILLDYSN